MSSTGGGCRPVRKLLGAAGAVTGHQAAPNGAGYAAIEFPVTPYGRKEHNRGVYRGRLPVSCGHLGYAPAATPSSGPRFPCNRDTWANSVTPDHPRPTLSGPVPDSRLHPVTGG
jgi:hypothetical protein